MKVKGHQCPDYFYKYSLHKITRFKNAKNYKSSTNHGGTRLFHSKFFVSLILRKRYPVRYCYEAVSKIYNVSLQETLKYSFASLKNAILSYKYLWMNV